MTLCLIVDLDIIEAAVVASYSRVANASIADVSVSSICIPVKLARVPLGSSPQSRQLS